VNVTHSPARPPRAGRRPPTPPATAARQHGSTHGDSAYPRRRGWRSLEGDHRALSTDSQRRFRYKPLPSISASYADRCESAPVAAPALGVSHQRRHVPARVLLLRSASAARRPASARSPARRARSRSRSARPRAASAARRAYHVQIAAVLVERRHQLIDPLVGASADTATTRAREVPASAARAQVAAEASIAIWPRSAFVTTSSPAFP